MSDNVILRDDSVAKVRDHQREVQKDVRQQKKEEILSHVRENVTDVKNSVDYISENEMKELALKLLKSEDQLSILHQIKSGCTFGESHIESFLRVSGIMQKLVGKLCCTDAESQLEAATCITNLATGSHKSTQKVARAAGAYLVTYMHGSSRYLQCQCAWAAGNIANDCENCFSVLNSQGLLPALKSLLDSPYPEVIQSTVYALNACSRYNSLEMQEMIQKNFIQALLQVLERNDVSHRTHVDSLFTLSNTILQALNFLSEEDLQKLASTVLNYLAKATINETIDTLVVTPSVRCLGNLSTGTVSLCNFILNHREFRPCTMKIMASNHYYLQKEMIWVFSNLLNFVDTSKNSYSWCWVMEYIKPFLSPLDNSAVQALYFLCILKTTKCNFENILIEMGLLSTLDILCSCGKEEIELAAKMLSAIKPLSVENVQS